LLKILLLERSPNNPFLNIVHNKMCFAGAQEKLGILNQGAVFAVFDYEAHNSDELSFSEGEQLVVLRKGDELEREWWWSKINAKEGYVPRNLLGVSSESFS